MKVTCQSQLLDRATDVPTMGAVLTDLICRHWGAKERLTCQIPRVMPRPGGEVLIQYRLTYSGQGDAELAPAMLYAQHFPESVQGPVPSEYESADSVWIEHLRLRIWLFPHDPQLDQLDLLFDSAKFHQAFDPGLENVGYGHLAMGTTSEILGYRLGRRCVVRVNGRQKPGMPPPPITKPDLVVKMCRPRNALALWTRWRQLEHEGFNGKNTDGIRVPKSLLLQEPSGAIFQEFSAGTSLHALIGTGPFVDGCRRAAQALTKLHRTSIPGLSRHTADDEIKHLLWLTDVTGAAFPSLQDDLAELLEDLVRSHAMPSGNSEVTSHRDFYDKQLLYHTAGATLLDCDTLALADPALDYGNFIAHLQWRMHQAPDASGNLRRGIDAFRNAYRVPDRDFLTRAAWWTAASLLRLGCLYAWRPRWRQKVPALLRARPVHTRHLAVQ